jgi:hypothetical protein
MPKSAFLSLRLLRLLGPPACVFGAGLLVASSAQAQLSIGYDPIMQGYDPKEYYKTGKDLSMLNAAFYIPFAFDFGGGLYSLDSVKLLLLGSGDVSTFSLIATSTLETDLTVPEILATFSGTGAVSTAAVFTFNADSPSLLTSGSTYYLRIAFTGSGDPHWVWREWKWGKPPSQGSNPNTSGGIDGFFGNGPSIDATLTPLLTLNPAVLTFRLAGESGYTDFRGVYGFSITATAVPEPAAFALGVAGLTFGAALFFRLRRRR